MGNEMDKKSLFDISFEEMDQYVEEHKELLPKKEKERKNIVFSVEKVIGQLSQNSYAPIFAIVDWGVYVRFDLRKWKEDMQKPGKGISFTREELEAVRGIKNVLDDQNFFGKTPKAHYRTEKASAEIYETIAVLSQQTSRTGVWKKEINVVDWGYGPKIDFRKWSEDYKKCTKEICITMKEFHTFCELVEEEL